MSLLPLVLGGRTRPFGEAAAKTAAPGVVPSRVFERDGNACRYCGFLSRKFQECHRLDGGVEDAGPSVDLDGNVTACFLCHQVQHLDRVGEWQSGVLIWLPEIGQAALHHLCRAMFVAQGVVGPMRQAADAAFAALQARSEEAKLRLGSDDPRVLAEAFDQLSETEYGRRGGSLAGLRLLPLKKRIEAGKDVWGQVVLHWRNADGPFGGALPQTWPSMLEKVVQTVQAGG